MTDHSLLTLIINASLPVQLVMLLLLGASVLSWALMYVKRGYIHQSQAEAKDFEGRFWSGINLNDLFGQLSSREQRRFGLEAIFENGFREFARARKAELKNSETVRSAHRAMKVAMAREIEMLENNLPFLATVGSVSPYVGLFGTVWGIMESFRALAGVQQATLAMVAPGISEALVATAMGLFAAIPAVIAYNRFSNQVDRLEVRYDNFKEEFSSILERQAHALGED